MNDPAVLANLVLALVPGILWCLYIHRKDVHEPEPLRYVLLAGVAGAAVVLFVKGLLHFLPVPPGSPDLASLLVTSLFIALTEEIPKAAALTLLFYRHPEFDEPMDGLVYGASVGIGFSTLENALYMTEHGRTILLVRMVISTTLHATCTGLIGYALGQLKFGHRGLVFVVMAAVLSLAIHMLFDGLAALGNLRPDLGWVTPATLVGILALVVILHHLLDRGSEDALGQSPFRPPEPPSTNA